MGDYLDDLACAGDPEAMREQARRQGYKEGLRKVAEATALPELTRQEFKPDWTSPPGDTIKDLMEDRGITENTLIQAIWPHTTRRSDFGRFLRGDIAVTPLVAEKLEAVLGGTKQFWLRREAFYRIELARLAQEEDT